MNKLYETDFNAWVHDQIEFLKKKDFDHLDILHLLEEMEEMGNSNRSAIESHLTNIFLHMLKVKYQPDMTCNSWNASITNSRLAIKRIIRRNPSLKRYPQEVFGECYQDAKEGAAKESGIKKTNFSKDCPWSLNEVLGN